MASAFIPTLDDARARTASLERRIAALMAEGAALRLAGDHSGSDRLAAAEMRLCDQIDSLEDEFPILRRERLARRRHAY